jgi:putative transposase
MDGKGRWVENALVERLRRSVKYAALYLHARDTPSEANTVLESEVHHLSPAQL